MKVRSSTCRPFSSTATTLPSFTETQSRRAYGLLVSAVLSRFKFKFKLHPSNKARSPVRSDAAPFVARVLGRTRPAVQATEL